MGSNVVLPSAGSAEMYDKEVSTQSFKKPLGDNIIPRGPRLDTFVRPYSYSAGIIGYPSAPAILIELRSFKSYPPMPGDDNVEALLRERPQVDYRLKNSLVKIETDVLDLDNGKYVTGFHCSGCLISNAYVFKCLHAFDLTGYDNCKIGMITVRNSFDTVSEATLVPIGSKFADVDYEKFVTLPDVAIWGKDLYGKATLDFALLKLKAPFSYSLNEIIEILDVPSWSPSTPLLSLGFPIRLNPRDLAASDYFSHDFWNSVSKWALTDPEPVFEKFLNLTCSRFRRGTAIACFGSPLWKSQCSKGYYGLSTMSAIYGCSGGPIVNPLRPTELVGLVMGSWHGNENSVFLDMQVPVIKQLYRDFRGRDV